MKEYGFQASPVIHQMSRSCAGDCHDKGTAGADGTHGECVQSRHPSHYLLSAAGLCSSDFARPTAAGDQEEEKCHPEV